MKVQVLLLSYIVFFSLQRLEALELAKPRLQSADIEWWWPKGDVPHMSLIYFENVNKRSLNSLYNAADIFKAKFNFETLHNSILDLLPNLRIIKEGAPEAYILNTWQEGPGGDERMYKELYKRFPPSPRSPWYLVIKFDNNETKQFIDSRDSLAFDIFQDFNVSPVSVPHITLGKINAINDPDKFYTLLKEVNERFAGRFMHRLDVPDDKNLIQLVKAGRPTENKYLLMLEFDRESIDGIRLNKAVKRLSKQEALLNKGVKKTPAILCPLRVPVTSEQATKFLYGKLQMLRNALVKLTQLLSFS